jgi:hypothetical protein
MKGKLLFACMSFGLSLSAVHPAAAQAANRPSLAGSWQLNLTPVSPTASVPLRVAALATFTSDGSVIETDATEVIPMMVEGLPNKPLHGWGAAGSRQYSTICREDRGYDSRGGSI